ncbi:hypothetical protein D3C84_870850 [compost metagenome]
MQFHLTADAPDLGHVRVAQHPVTLERVADIDHAARLHLEPLGRVIRQLSQGFRVSDPHPNRDAGAAQHLAADLASEDIPSVDAG